MSNLHPVFAAITSTFIRPMDEFSIRYHANLGDAGEEVLVEVFYQESAGVGPRWIAHAVYHNDEQLPKWMEEKLCDYFTYDDRRFQRSCDMKVEDSWMPGDFPIGGKK